MGSENPVRVRLRVAATKCRLTAGIPSNSQPVEWKMSETGLAAQSPSGARRAVRNRPVANKAEDGGGPERESVTRQNSLLGEDPRYRPEREPERAQGRDLAEDGLLLGTDS